MSTTSKMPQSESGSSLSSFVIYSDVHDIHSRSRRNHYIAIENQCNQLLQKRILSEKRLNAKTDKIHQFTALHNAHAANLINKIEAKNRESQIRNNNLVKNFTDMSNIIDHTVSNASTNKGLINALAAYHSKIRVSLPAFLASQQVADAFQRQIRERALQAEQAREEEAKKRQEQEYNVAYIHQNQTQNAPNRSTNSSTSIGSIGSSIGTHKTKESSISQASTIIRTHTHGSSPRNGNIPQNIYSNSNSNGTGTGTDAGTGIGTGIGTGTGTGTSNINISRSINQSNGNEDSSLFIYSESGSGSGRSGSSSHHSRSLSSNSNNHSHNSIDNKASDSSNGSSNNHKNLINITGVTCDGDISNSSVMYSYAAEYSNGNGNDNVSTSSHSHHSVSSVGSSLSNYRSIRPPALRIVDNEGDEGDDNDFDHGQGQGEGQGQTSTLSNSNSNVDPNKDLEDVHLESYMYYATTAGGESPGLNTNFLKAPSPFKNASPSTAVVTRGKGGGLLSPRIGGSAAMSPNSPSNASISTSHIMSSDNSISSDSGIFRYAPSPGASASNRASGASRQKSSHGSPHIRIPGSPNPLPRTTTNTKSASAFGFDDDENNQHVGATNTYKDSHSIDMGSIGNHGIMSSSSPNSTAIAGGNNSNSYLGGQSALSINQSTSVIVNVTTSRLDFTSMLDDEIDDDEEILSVPQIVDLEETIGGGRGR